MESEIDSSDASNLPWIWFLESLAKNKEVDYLTLRDVARKVPCLSGDAAKHARELLALRCLEGLAEKSHGANGIPGEKIGLDLSKRCSVVLYNLTSEAVNSSSGWEGLEVSKWDIRSFVEHKRARLTKCTLEMLEDMVLEGKVPAAVSLRDIIENKRVDPSEDVDIVDGAAKVVSLACKENETARMAQVMDSIPKNEEASCHDVGKVVLPQDDGDLHSKFEKSVEDMNAGDDRPLLVSDVGDKAPDKCRESSAMMEDGYDRTKTTQVNDIEMEQSSKQRDHDNQHFLTLQDNQKLSSATPQALAANTVLEEEEEVIEKINSSAGLDAPATVNCNKQQAGLSMANQINVTKSDRNPDFNDEPVHEVVVETLREPTPVANNPSDVECDSENADAASVKNIFMGSQSTAIDWTETDPTLCVKCNQSGALLCCSVCPITVHSECMGVEPCLDDSGSFRCPVCAISLAVAKYEEAKSRADIRKRELDVFRRSSLSCKFPKHFLKRKKERTSKQEHMSSPMKGHIFPEIHGDADVNPTHESPPAGMTGDLPCRKMNGTATGHGDLGAVVEPSILQVEDILPPPKGKNTTTDYMTYQPQDAFTQATLTSDEFEQQNRYAIILYEGDKGYNTKEAINENPSESIIKHIRPARNILNLKVAKTTSDVPYHSYPAYRRRKVPWTQDEENKLREGVKEFYNPETGSVIPWSQILEFGALVFQPCRTAENLKDKWKNICKKDK